MHSLGLLQVLVRQMKPGAAHQNAEVHDDCDTFITLLGT